MTGKQLQGLSAKACRCCYTEFIERGVVECYEEGYARFRFGVGGQDLGFRAQGFRADGFGFWSLSYLDAQGMSHI